MLTITNEDNKKGKKGFQKGNTYSRFTGKKHTQEWKDNMSIIKTKNPPMKNKETIAKRSATLKNKGIFKGERNHFWKGGITPINATIRESNEYKLWRKSVFIRDNYTCQECGLRSKAGCIIIIEAHHIKPFYIFPEMRFIVDNGITLCKKCHNKKPKGREILCQNFK
jgi:hypothetical protein